MGRWALLFVAFFALFLAACGGGSSTYTLAKTKTCLQTRGVTIGGTDGDFVASTATGGAFNAELGDNSVKLVFGLTDADATQIVLAYERFAFQNVRSGLPDILRRVNNAVMLWHEHPQDADLALVLGCLK